MYNDHFGLNRKPFQITSDPKFLWPGEKHKEALATLRYGIQDNRGFLLMTGEVGTGKTILINRLLTLLDDSTVVATLKDPDLETLDFYNVLADELGMNQTFTTKGQFLIHFSKFLRRCYDNQQQVLLVIDESQRLNHKIMEDIRTLSNIELHDRKLINIFFVGQQEFNNILMTPENRALSQRITVRYHIEPLDENETDEYIRHRLEVAGTSKTIFKKSAVSEVFKISRGLPRLINIICDHALLTAFTLNIPQVDGEIVKECADELRIPVHKPKVEAAIFRNGSGRRRLGGIMLPATVDGATLSSNAFPKGGHLSSPPRATRSSRWSYWLPNIAAILVIIVLLTYIFDRFTGHSMPDMVNSPSTSETNLADSETPHLLPKSEDSDHDVSQSSFAQTNSRDVAQPGRTEEAQPGGRSAAQPIGGEAGAAMRMESSDATHVIASSQNQVPKTVAKGVLNFKEDGNEAEESNLEHAQSFLQDKIIIPFTFSSNDIDTANYMILDRIAGYLMRYPEKSINVRGYTDVSGPDSYNESVSFFRANEVKSYLVSKGVSPDNIVTYAMGGANPIASNASIEGRKRNRRVEIELKPN